MKIIANGRIKIAHDHEAERNIDLPCKKVDRGEIEDDDNDPIGDRFQDRSFPG